MAKPKNEEEQRIYEELLEKYKEEGTFGLGMIEGIAKDESMRIPWKEIPKELEKIFHY